MTNITYHLQVREHGMEDGVMTIEEIRFGDDTRGTGSPELSSTLLCTVDPLNKKISINLGLPFNS